MITECERTRECAEPQFFVGDRATCDTRGFFRTSENKGSHRRLSCHRWTTLDGFGMGSSPTRVPTTQKELTIRNGLGDSEPSGHGGVTGSLVG